MMMNLVISTVISAQPQSTHPVWSPDGTSIAFMNNSIGDENDNPINFEIYTVLLKENEIVRHTANTSFDADVAWSPNGTHLAIKSYRDGNDEIYMIDLKSGKQTNISNHAGRDSSPFWSRESNSIYFQSDRDHKKGELYAYDLNSKEITRLTKNSFSESGAVWSPDGNLIAFVSDMDGDDDIYLMSIKDMEPIQLTDNELSDWYPQWSPDGKEILFTYGDWETNTFELRLINVDGSNQKTIISTSDSGNASWHPSGQKIAYGISTEKGGEIFLFDINTQKHSMLISYKDF